MRKLFILLFSVPLHCWWHKIPTPFRKQWQTMIMRFGIDAYWYGRRLFPYSIKRESAESLGNNRKRSSIWRSRDARFSESTSLYWSSRVLQVIIKNKQALKYYQKAVDLNPDNKYARIQYITLLLNQRKFDEALGESSLLTETDSSVAGCITSTSLKVLKGRCILSHWDAMKTYRKNYPNDFYLVAAKAARSYYRRSIL